MTLDYSKWDALEISDDSDIEVHPNVDKRSFIRAKQNQIHMERQQRKHQIETLKYERIINDGLMKRISALLAALKARAGEVQSQQRSAGEVAFQAVMESAGRPEDDQPPPRPEGVHANEEPLPSYSKMMASLLDEVNKSLDEKKVETDGRYEAMVAGIEEHLGKVNKLQAELVEKLEELEKVERSKITSESIRTGFDSSHINKSKPEDKKKDGGGGGGGEGGGQQVELLNPNFAAAASSSSSSSQQQQGGSHDDFDEEMEASPKAKLFSQIRPDDYSANMEFLMKNPEIVTERETDGLLALAFNAALEGKNDRCRQCVHQALLLQYCRLLGRDGVAVFFKRMNTKGHQARDLFFKDVQDMYGRIVTRTREIVAQRAKEPEEVAQIQLHAVEPGTEIKINIPAADAETVEGKEARMIFESFSPDFRKALESGSLDEVNKVLGEMKVEEAEEVVGKLSEAGILSMEEQIIDATTEEGRKALKEREAAEASTESGFAPDPE